MDVISPGLVRPDLLWWFALSGDILPDVKQGAPWGYREIFYLVRGGSPLSALSVFFFFSFSLSFRLPHKLTVLHRPFH